MRRLWGDRASHPAECAINRPIYTGGAAPPLKWGPGGLAVDEGRESMAARSAGEVVSAQFRRHGDAGENGMPSFAEAARLLHETPRRAALDALFRAASAASLVSALAACGGGGGAPIPPPSPPPPAPSPAPTPNAPIAAQLTVPTPVGYDADRLAAFNRLNEIRLSAGLGMLAQNAAMDQAAQAHAAWIIANDSFTHEEGVGTVGFTGTHWWDRDEGLGYVPIGGDEVMVGSVHGAQGVDVLVNAVYHREAILAFEPVDIGVGWSGLAAPTVSMPLIIDLTRPGGDSARDMGQAAQASTGGVVVWPISGALNVPLRLGLEFPNPVPSQDVLTLGTPASITVDRFKTITTTSFVMTNTTNGSVVPTSLLTNQNDPNSLTPGSFVAVIPLRALDPATTYQVAFSGSTDEFPSGAHEAINEVWSFSTAAP